MVSRVFFHVFRGTVKDDPAAQVDRNSRAWPRLRGAKTTESRVFTLAYRLGGRVTLSDVVMETGLGMTDAEMLMNEMVDELHVRMVVQDDGQVIYEFPEVISRLDRESR